MKPEWIVCPNCNELIFLKSNSNHFLSPAQMTKLQDYGIAEKVYSRKDPSMSFYSVAGVIYVWNGMKYRKTTVSYKDNDFYI